MVPMTGRPLRGRALHQGDELHGFATWRAIDGCPVAPDRKERAGALSCRIWLGPARCSSGRELALCLHPGAHEVEAGWIIDAFHWMDQLPATAKGGDQSGSR
jgi:polyhydroxybutyrate depolymerase